MAMSGAGTTLLYSEQHFDRLTGLSHNEAREYRTQTGSFFMIDPFAGDFSNPQSLNKQLYTHGNPVMGRDPTGWFSIGELLASLTTGFSLRQKEGSQAANASNSVHILKKIVTFQKKMHELVEKANKVWDVAKDIQDLLSFDPTDVADLVRMMMSSGLRGLLSDLPVGRVQRPFTLPPGISKKCNAFVQKAQNALSMVGRINAQELLGELMTATFVRVLDFDQIPTSWSWVPRNNGPDQVAKSPLGVWGVFEAKGGKSTLPSTDHGQEMSGGWLKHWLRSIINNQNNQGALRDDLSNAFTRGDAMLAAVVRIHVQRKRVQLKVTAQRYAPPDGRTLTGGAMDWSNA